MQWTHFASGQRIPIKSWCESVEPGALAQAINLASHPVIERHVALMPDCHVGYGMPIGGVIAARNAILPSAVGVDIGCGMIAVETNIPAERFTAMSLRQALLIRLKERILVGEGVAHKEEQRWDGFERYLDAHGTVCDFPNSLDRKNLGTLGGGNHFIELQKSSAGCIWLMIHSGSRNLGHRVEKYYQTVAQAYNERERIALPDPVLAFLPMDNPAGQAYFRDMTFALAYALENRRRMMAVFKETLSEFVSEMSVLQEINIHHNYAALEQHGGEDLYIHRKGATRAQSGEIGIIPGSMGTASYIVCGRGNPESFMSCSHGAGRTMSRSEASRVLTVAECDAALDGIVYDRWQARKSFGRKKGGGQLDLSEAPQAYKAIDAVIAAQTDLIETLIHLMPLAVLKG